MSGPVACVAVTQRSPRPDQDLVTKLLLRDPRDEAPLRDARTTGRIDTRSGSERSQAVKQRFIAEVTKLELRDQKASVSKTTLELDGQSRLRQTPRRPWFMILENRL